MVDIHCLEKHKMIKDNLNPNFSKTFILDYYFEVKQRLRFEVVDFDGPATYNFIGEVFTSLDKLVGAKNQTSIYDFKDKQNNTTGKLILQSEQVRECSEFLRLQISAENLPKNTSMLPRFLPGLKVGFLGYTSPLMRLYRSREDGNWLLVYQSSTLNRNQSPTWDEFEISLQKLCNGDHYRPVKLECVAENGNNEFSILGETTFNVMDLVSNQKREFK